MSAQGPGDSTAAILAQLTEQASAIVALQPLAGQVKDLRAEVKRLSSDEDKEAKEGYHPGPAPRWWLRGDPALTGEQQEQLAKALVTIRGWITDIYRPMYGHLAETLPRCWDRHPLCLITLDWLSELWQALYLQPKRASLAMQADFSIRLLPSAAEQMAREAEDCGHQPPRAPQAGADPWAGTP